MVRKAKIVTLVVILMFTFACGASPANPAATSKWLNTIGLIFGIIGVVLIFFWGPPQPSFERGAYIGLQDNTRLPNGRTVAENNADVEASEKRHKRISQIGLVLVGLSFALQLWSVWV